jgi:uncharacterized damage-inducible protein DinB
MLNKLSLLLICLSFLVSSNLPAQDSFLSDYKIKWKNATEYTLEFAKAMPEETYSFKPVPVEMSYGEQLKHIAGNMVWLCSSYLGGAKTTLDPMNAGTSKKEIIAVLEKSFAYAAETVDHLNEKVLNQNVDFFAGFMTKRRILLLMTDHVTHHRGQLVVYLRLNGIEPPAYRGW